MIQVKDGISRRLHHGTMTVSFRVAALSADQVPQAFPLIQATWPSADLPAWENFVAFFNDHISAGNAGVLAIRDCSEAICGVLAYRLDRDLRSGRILAVQLFTAMDLINSPQTVRALLDAAEARAKELSCMGLQIRLYGDQGGLASRLRRLGLMSEGGVLWKKIDPPETRN